MPGLITDQDPSQLTISPTDASLLGTHDLTVNVSDTLKYSLYPLKIIVNLHEAPAFSAAISDQSFEASNVLMEILIPQITDPENDICTCRLTLGPLWLGMDEC